MRISVENFGPVRNAKIAIKPLTVFIGPNAKVNHTLHILYGISTLLSLTLQRLEN